MKSIFSTIVAKKVEKVKKGKKMIIRKLDELGRIVIPKEMRKKASIKDNELLEIEERGGRIIISKSGSYICQQCGQLVDKTDRYCRNCGKELIRENRNEL